MSVTSLQPKHATVLDPARWPFRIEPLAPVLGGEIIGVDLSGEMSPELFAAIYGAFLRYQVLVFRGQDVSPSRQVELARCFGEVQVHVMNQYHADGHPELYYLTNVGPDGKPSGRHPDRGTMAWHTDGSWSRRPGQATIIFSDEVPARGGETHFCDMYAAWEKLSAQRQAALLPLRAVHSLDFSRNRRHGEDPMTEAQKRDKPPVDHPVVRTHPETGRSCLFLGDHAESIQGMDYAAGRALIEAVNAEAIHPSRIYEHRWRAGDLIVWDNRCLLHRATEYDTATVRRVMRRCTVIGEIPVSGVS